MTTKQYWDRLIPDEHNAPIKYGKNKSKYDPDHSNSRKQKESGRVIYDTQDFKCRNCGFFVTVSRELSGVNNRNHCPRCLWSRHMDITPGDRRSDCLSRMKPVGLTVKHVTKKYGSTAGELMVIHICAGCGKISINRIAADDESQVIYRIFTDSFNLPLDRRHLLEQENIHILQSTESEIVNSQLFGLPVFM